MSITRKAVAAAIAMATTAGIAQAHEFECIKKANGQDVYTITEYPADVTWTLTAKNIHPTETSVATGLEDPLLEALGFTFDPAAPVSVPVGQQQTWTFTQHFDNARECLDEAAKDGYEDQNIDNTFRVIWDQGEDQCSARVVCQPPPPPPPPPPNESGATRTMGFYKTHLDAMQACLLGGAVDLGPGFAVIDSVTSAEGLLWASPSRYDDGTRRTDLDRDRFLLARQTLVGICNERLFGTTPTPPNLIDEALTALGGTDCSSLTDLASQVDAYNNSGDSVDFPNGFTAGPATPKTAAALADGNDPSVETGETCGGFSLNSK